jgi:hypothetical protein
MFKQLFPFFLFLIPEKVFTNVVLAFLYKIFEPLNIFLRTNVCISTRDSLGHRGVREHEESEWT